MKNKKSLITTILILIGLFISGFISGSSCKSAQKTDLQTCLQAGISDGIFSTEAIKDSAFIKECRPFHREILIDKYLYEITRDPKTGKIIKTKWKLKKGERPYKISDILYYIENGSFPR